MDIFEFINIYLTENIKFRHVSSRFYIYNGNRNNTVKYMIYLFQLPNNG